MIAPEGLKLLCCPETHQSLVLAGPGLVGELNARIAAGEVRNRASQIVTMRLDGGVIREDGRFLYPVRGTFPVLLVDEAIPLNV